MSTLVYRDKLAEILSRLPRHDAADIRHDQRESLVVIIPRLPRELRFRIGRTQLHAWIGELSTILELDDSFTIYSRDIKCTEYDPYKWNIEECVMIYDSQKGIVSEEYLCQCTE